MPIRIELIADNADELAGMIAKLAPIAFGRGTPLATPTTGHNVMTTADGKVAAVVEMSEDMGVADEADPNAPAEEADESDTAATAETQAKRGRGRPAGAKNKPKPAEDEAPKDTAEPEPAIDAKAQEKKRDKAIELLTKVFARGQAGQKAVRELQVKWGVAKFSEVELDFADKLLAEATALSDGVK